MSNVTSHEIIGAVARAYGIGREHITDPSSMDEIGRTTAYTERIRRQARIVCMYLMDRHKGMHRAAICDALGMPKNTSTYGAIDLALAMAPGYRTYDAVIGKRIEHAERLIDAAHERRLSEQLDHAHRREIERPGIAA